MTKFLGNFTLNLGKVCKKSVEFQNIFRECLKVKTLELQNLDQVEITEINILKNEECKGTSTLCRAAHNGKVRQGRVTKVAPCHKYMWTLRRHAVRCCVA